MSPFLYHAHIQTRTIVLPARKVLYVAMPKAAWTSLLWLLAEPAGLSRERFVVSAKPEVTLPMTVHDMGIWRQAGLLLDTMTEHERADVLSGNGWFRFTVVRDPATRLFSAWQSKLLLREPAYVDAFGHQPWFPRIPTCADDIVEDFRAFTLALRDHAWSDDVRDVHWAPQHLLAHRIPLDHIGRVEQLELTLARLRVHLGSHADRLKPPRRENRALLPYVPAVYDDKAAETVTDLYAADYEQFGYQPVRVDVDDRALAEWETRTTEVLPFLREMIARHERLGALHGVMQARHEALSKRMNSQRQHIQTLERRVATHQQRSEAERRLHAELRQQLQQIADDRHRLRRRLRRVRHSRSWKLTRPLRAVRHLIRDGRVARR